MRLSVDRQHVNFETFLKEVGSGPLKDEVALLLWQKLRTEHTFVKDFRPLPNDDLAKVFAMGPEEVRDDLIEPIITDLNIDVSNIDFIGFDFRSIKTLKDVVCFFYI
jgi:hypothetical protein